MVKFLKYNFSCLIFLIENVLNNIKENEKIDLHSLDEDKTSVLCFIHLNFV